MRWTGTHRAISPRAVFGAAALAAIAALAALAVFTPTAAAAQPTTLTATVTPGVVAYGGSAVLSGRLEAGGAGVAHAALTVSWSPDDLTWSELPAVVSDDNGAYSLQVIPDPAAGSVRYRVAFAGDAERDPAQAEVPLGVRASVAKPSAPQNVGRGTAFTTSGVLRPALDADSAAVRISCYRRESGKWVRRLTVTATVVNGDGDSADYRARIKLPSAGTWRLRTQYEAANPAQATHAADAAAYVPTWSSASSSITVTAKADLPVWDRDGHTTIPERMRSRLNARQLVVITGSSLGARHATLRIYEYKSGDWVRTWQVPVRLGTYGLIDGLKRRAGSRTTPTGIWTMARYAFGRHARPPSGRTLRWRRITQRSWWSSERNSTYNTWVETSRHVYGEHLADYPRSYEFAISSGYNALPNQRVYGRGSGIFLHVIHPGYSGGCIMLSRSTMIRLLRLLDPDKRPACAIGTTRAGTKTSIWAY